MATGRLTAGVKQSLVSSLAALAMIATAAARQDTAINLYAAPSASGSSCSEADPCSLFGAQAMVRALNAKMRGDIVVNLTEGTYELSSTLALTEADSGSNGFTVIYRNAPGASPVISGGTKITSWTLHDDRLGIWKAPVGPSHRFRQIYVNGTRSIRARKPNLTDYATRGPFLTGKGDTSPSAPYTITVDPSELEPWGNLNEVELVLINHWKHKRVRIESFKDGIITLRSPENADPVLAHMNQGTPPRFYENAYEFLDAEGEWYLDASTNHLYYKPRPDESMTEATVIAPMLDQLLTITGASSRNMARDIRITGLRFEYSNMTLPSTQGYTNYQGGLWSDSGLWPRGNHPYPAAIRMQNARNVTVDSNVIRHTGAHAILALDDVKDSVFDHNAITDTSSGGIYLALRNGNSSGNRVTYNTISYGGIEYTDTVGILLYFAPNSVVNFNEISQYRYTGISVGFNWTDEGTAAKNIEVGYNYIHDVVLLHDDGAGIYTLGKIPDMDIHDNYIRGVTASRYNGGWAVAGIYLDNGSSEKTVQNNVLDWVEQTFFAGNPDTHRNEFRRNYHNSRLGNVPSSNAIRDNVLVAGTDWPDSALAIIANAGTHGSSERAERRVP